MKKFLSFFSFIVITLITFNLNVQANTTEQVLYKYGTQTPVTYSNTSTPVTIPTNTSYLKQEFRGVWVTTIWNLDVPKHTSELQYKTMFTNMLNTLDAYNMNVLIYQVRPKNDAMYESALNPWSRFMTGVEGVSPGWDPLPWMIEETHKRGMEFHAWFNPYRVFLTDLSPNNFAAKNPNYVLKLAAGEEILNPGIPEVQKFVVDTVLEVANKYNIDGVHFDDYFYPYGGLATTYDSTQFQQYNPQKLSLADWRRENVNKVIRTLKTELNNINTNQNRAIKLGMSPFGVWANKSNNSLGSNTKSGVQSYSELYADSYKWVKEEMIDYIVPQTYWEFTDANAPYADVVDWWVNLVKGTKVNLYTGQSIYRYKEGGWNTGPWANPDELGNQLLFNSKYSEISGSVYFRYNYLINSTANPANLTYGQNALKNNYYKYKVLPPAAKNVDSIAPTAPEQLSVLNVEQGNQLNWKKDLDAKAYYVYRFNETENVNLDDISKVINIVWPTSSDTLTYTDSTATSGTVYNYYITAFDKANNQGPATQINSNQVVVTPEEPPVTPPQEPEVPPVNPDDAILVEINNNIKLIQQKIDDLYHLIQLTSTKPTSYQEIKTFGNNILIDMDSLKSEINLYYVQLKNINDFDLDILSKSIINLENNLNTTNVDDLLVTLNTIQTSKVNLISKIFDIESNINLLESIKTKINNDNLKFNDLIVNLPPISESEFNDLTTKLTDIKNILEIINIDKGKLSSIPQKLIDDLNLITEDINSNQSQINTLEESYNSALSITNYLPYVNNLMISNTTEITTLYNEIDTYLDVFNTKIVDTEQKLANLSIQIIELKQNEDIEEPIEDPIEEPTTTEKPSDKVIEIPVEGTSDSIVDEIINKVKNVDYFDPVFISISLATLMLLGTVVIVFKK